MLRTVTKFPDLLRSCFTRFSGLCFWRSHEVLHSQINIKFNNHDLFSFCAFLNSSKGPSQGTSFYWALLYWASWILRFLFLQIEGLWQLCTEQVYQHHFSSSICSLHVSVSHFDNSSNISNPLPARRSVHAEVSDVG